jgi:hypothetical protein
MGKCNERQMCQEGGSDVAGCSIDYFWRGVYSTKEFMSEEICLVLNQNCVIHFALSQ